MSHVQSARYTITNEVEPAHWRNRRNGKQHCVDLGEDTPFFVICQLDHVFLRVERIPSGWTENEAIDCAVEVIIDCDAIPRHVEGSSVRSYTRNAHLSRLRAWASRVHNNVLRFLGECEGVIPDPAPSSPVASPVHPTYESVMLAMDGMEEDGIDDDNVSIISSEGGHDMSASGLLIPAPVLNLGAPTGSADFPHEHLVNVADPDLPIPGESITSEGLSALFSPQRPETPPPQVCLPDCVFCMATRAAVVVSAPCGCLTFCVDCHASGHHTRYKRCPRCNDNAEVAHIRVRGLIAT